MANLTEALEKLEYWLWHNYPDICAALPPGITDEQIAEECEHLSFEISEEVRQFYRWRNGASNIFYSTNFGEGIFTYSIHKAVELTIDLTGDGYVCDLIKSHQINDALFMFGDFERWLHFVDCRDRDTSPVLILTDDDYTRLTHTSFTSMTLMTLECYEEKVLTFDEFGRVRLNNMEDYRTIFAKYNANQDDIRKQYGDSIDIYLDLK